MNGKPMNKTIDVDLVRSMLCTKIIGAKLLYFDSIDSTMDTIRGLPKQIAKEGTVVIAGLQKKGRGRFGRSWISESGMDILISILFKPDYQMLRSLNMAVALSVTDTIKEFTDLHPTIKWPNDIRIKGRKIAGILIEADTDVSGTDCFVGIGLNVNSNPNHFSTEFEATSLYSETFINFDMTEVLAVLLKHLDIRYHSIGSLDIVTEWKHLLDTIGQDIQITSKISNQVYNGNAIDVGKNGDLIVKLKDGSIREFSSGEITLQQ